MRKILIMCFVAAGCAGCQVVEKQITAQSILAGVKVKGSAATFREYALGSVPRWHSILKGIETGDAQWLAVANELKPASDASYSQDLEFSVATALAKNPAGVLRLTHFRLDQVCDVPYLEPSEKVLRDYQAKARAALDQVTQSNLQDRKKRCEAILMAP